MRDMFPHSEAIPVRLAVARAQLEASLGSGVTVGVGEVVVEVAAGSDEAVTGSTAT